MPTSNNIAQPISVFRVVDTMGAQAAVRRFPEKQLQTFLVGTPVQIDAAGATGFLIACPTISSAATALIAGFSLELGHNFANNGVAPGNVFQSQTAGAPVNQPSAVIIPGGAWPTDGTVPGSQGIALAADVNEFVGVLGNSNNNNNNITIVQALEDTLAGLSKDSVNNYWFVDSNNNTAALGGCVQIVGFVDPIGTVNGRVIFRVTHAAAQLRA